MKPSKLIDRYLAAVGMHLPSKTRADVQLELRSAIQDALEERGLDADKPEDHPAVVELLREFGRPEAIALSYGSNSYLIGPQTMPYYYMVLRVSGTIITALHLIGLAAALVTGGQTPFSAGNVLSNFFSTLFASFGIITLIFALIERRVLNINLAEDDWDPQSLPEVQPDPQRVNIFDKVVEVFFLIIFIALVNFFPDWSPGMPDLDLLPPDFDIIPAIVGQLGAHKLWFTIVWSGEVVVGVMALIRRRWNKALRAADVLFAFGSVALVGRITANLAGRAGAGVLEQTLMISFIVTFLILLVDASARLYKLWRANQSLRGLLNEGEK
ncbi:MAG: hypothetical protein KIS85_00930 [Anaerolineales bacterium]|nr:hypothetical protein [Anaerolineales bacterium]